MRTCFWLQGHNANSISWLTSSLPTSLLYLIINVPFLTISFRMSSIYGQGLQLFNVYWNTYIDGKSPCFILNTTTRCFAFWTAVSKSFIVITGFLCLIRAASTASWKLSAAMTVWPDSKNFSTISSTWTSSEFISNIKYKKRFQILFCVN